MHDARRFPHFSLKLLGSAAVLGLAMVTAPFVNTAFAQAGATPAARAAAAKATIDLDAAWVRATPGGATNAAVYLRIVNAGKEPDTLNGAETANARRATIHTTAMTGNVATMNMAPGLPIPRAATMSLAPGGSHIMLEGLKAPLHEGESFIITLNFAKAGKISCTVKVVGVAANGASAAAASTGTAAGKPPAPPAAERHHGPGPDPHDQ